MAGNQGAGAPCVLVVDDEAVSLMMASHITQRAGYEVVQARSVAEALEVLGNADVKIDMVISDFMMSGGTGLDLLEAVPDPNIPFVLLTGVMEISEFEDARVERVTAYLTKPFASHALLDVLSKLLPLTPSR
jgi:two-component system cell cycle sensor histidine kinase/response regulator CckA